MPRFPSPCLFGFGWSGWGFLFALASCIFLFFLHLGQLGHPTLGWLVGLFATIQFRLSPLRSGIFSQSSRSCIFLSFKKGWGGRAVGFYFWVVFGKFCVPKQHEMLPFFCFGFLLCWVFSLFVILSSIRLRVSL